MLVVPYLWDTEKSPLITLFLYERAEETPVKADPSPANEASNKELFFDTISIEHS